MQYIFYFGLGCLLATNHSNLPKTSGPVKFLVIRDDCETQNFENCTRVKPPFRKSTVIELSEGKLLIIFRRYESYIKGAAYMFITLFKQHIENQTLQAYKREIEIN